MISYTGLQVPTPILRELLDFLHQRGNEIDPSDAVAQALRAWLDNQRRNELMDADQAPDGYMWKNVFLPNGTRINFAGRTEFGGAFVVNGQFVYRGTPMSPNKFAALAGENTRNAWRDLVVRIPGEVRPKRASVLRRELEGKIRKPAQILAERALKKAPTDAELLPLPYKAPKLSMGEIPDWVMNNRRKNCKCLGDTMFED